jgi:hypothetical protein
LELAEEAYYSALTPLGAAEGRLFQRVNIVGTKYYEGLKQYDSLPKDRKFLFLVPDVKNNFDAHAIMLHTGTTKIGYASRGGPLREMREQFTKWGIHTTSFTPDQVLVCEIVERLGEDLIITATHIVPERVARKFSQMKIKGA